MQSISFFNRTNIVTVMSTEYHFDIMDRHVERSRDIPSLLAPSWFFTLWKFLESQEISPLRYAPVDMTIFITPLRETLCQTLRHLVVKI